MLGLLTSAAAADTCPDGHSIRTRVCSLAQHHYLPYPNYQIPACDGYHPPTEGQLTQIERAFDLAPSGVQQGLCSATILVNQYDDQDPFGFWVNPIYHGPPNNITFISIPSSYFALRFSNAQTLNLNGLHLAGATHWEQVPTGTDPFAVGLLYMMAHELAHTKWVQAAPSYCVKDSWTDQALNIAGNRRWVGFGDEIRGHGRDARYLPMPSELYGPNDIARIYNGGFVTVLAAASPIEDYVETYAVRSLNKCTNCQFYIQPSGGFSIPINDAGNSTSLQNKFDCVDQQIGH
jgi:hypothetical protein